MTASRRLMPSLTKFASDIELCCSRCGAAVLQCAAYQACSQLITASRNQSDYMQHNIKLSEYQTVVSQCQRPGSRSRLCSAMSTVQSHVHRAADIITTLFHKLFTDLCMMVHGTERIHINRILGS